MESQCQPAKGRIGAIASLFYATAALIREIRQIEEKHPGSISEAYRKKRAWILTQAKKVSEPEIPESGWGRFSALLGAGGFGFLSWSFALVLTGQFLFLSNSFIWNDLANNTLSLGDQLCVFCLSLFLALTIAGYSKIARWQYGLLRRALAKDAPAY